MVTALVLAAVAVPAGAREQVISDPDAADWVFEGDARVKVVDAAGLPGGKALLVTVPRKGVNPWDIQARLKMKDGVAAGDRLAFGFYARAEKPDPGKQTASVNVRVQRDAAPYDAALEGPLEISSDWTFNCLTGPAQLALSPQEMTVSVQLAGERHAIVFGPFLMTRIPANESATLSGLPCGQRIPG